jgi:hypothetical protein
MDPIIAFTALCFGLLMRLALPIVITIVLVCLLRNLDARWQLEAERQPAPVKKPECWKIKNCLPEQCRECPAFSSPLPCWQVFRLPNGYLRKDCLSCKVFNEALSPALQNTTSIS